MRAAFAAGERQDMAGWIALVGLIVARAVGTAAAGGSRCVPVAEAPRRYAEQEVLVCGPVARKERAVFPSGRVYYTLALGEEPRVVTVFSWVEPQVEPGDRVEVGGAFHLWRYNLRRVFEAGRIEPVPSWQSAGAPPTREGVHE